MSYDLLDLLSVDLTNGSEQPLFDGEELRSPSNNRRIDLAGGESQCNRPVRASEAVFAAVESEPKSSATLSARDDRQAVPLAAISST